MLDDSQFNIANIKELMNPLAKQRGKDYQAIPGMALRRSTTWKVYKRGNPVPEVSDRQVHVDTISIQHVPIDPSFFTTGKDFTPVRDKAELLFSDYGEKH